MRIYLFLISILTCSFINTINVGKYASFDLFFKKKLLENKIDEPEINIILFNNILILIGSLSDANNINNILKVANSLSNKSVKFKKIYNFMIYQHGIENKKLKLDIVNKFKLNKYIISKNYEVFTINKTVWIIGSAKTYYEKTLIIRMLDDLKKSKKINQYYCCITYFPSISKGFVYRH